MELDLTRLPRGDRSWIALIDYAASVGDLAEATWLELKGRLPLACKPDRTRSGVVLARAIIGMANRMPDAASTSLAGYGVVLVGVSKSGALEGADTVDGADLEQALNPYVGQDGPVWDFRFVQHPSGLVMAVIVDPPAWGDPIRSCRKAFQDNGSKLSVRDGDIFVRRPGKTELASSAEIRDLERRRLKAPHADAKVTVGYTDGFQRFDVASGIQVVEDAIRNSAQELLSSIPQTKEPDRSIGRGLVVNMPNWLQPDEEAYRADVAEWQSACLGAAEQVATDLMRFGMAQGELTITNHSPTYLEGVRAQAEFPEGVLVLRRSDLRYTDRELEELDLFDLLPDRPPAWGAFDGVRVDPIDLPVIPLSGYEVYERSGSTVVSWSLGDLRPEDTVYSTEQFAVICAEDRETVPVTWRVTARGINHVFTGAFEIVRTDDDDEDEEVDQTA